MPSVFPFFTMEVKKRIGILLVVLTYCTNLTSGQRLDRQSSFGSSSSSNLQPSLACPLLPFGQPCFNDGQCYTDSTGYKFCVCKPKFSGPLCQNVKPISQKRAQDYVPDRSHMKTYQNSKYVDKIFRDSDTWGRHIAKTIDECTQFCVEAGRSCGSFNFGPDGNSGKNLCQLLAVRQSQKNPLLKTWIETGHPGWVYVCCF